MDWKLEDVQSTNRWVNSVCSPKGLHLILFYLGSLLLSLLGIPLILGLQIIHVGLHQLHLVAYKLTVDGDWG